MQLAWAAGFFDGEGTVNLYLNRTSGRTPYWQRQISVGGTHLPSIEHFLSLVEVGKIYHRPPRKPTHRPFHNWLTTGPKLDQVARALRPFLVTKRKQVDLILRVGSLLQRKPFEPISQENFERVEDIMYEMRGLNGNQKSGRTFKRPTKAEIIEEES